MPLPELSVHGLAKKCANKFAFSGGVSATLPSTERSGICSFGVEIRANIFFGLLPPFKAAIDLVFQLGSFLSKISGLQLSESQRTSLSSRFVLLPVLRITAVYSCVKESPLCASQLM